MRATRSSNQRERKATLAVPNFKCVVIYEDAAAGRRAQEFYNKLVAAMDGECVPSHNLWSFPVLAISEMRNLAVSAAAAADMVATC
jgi:hypothetical protein